MDGRRKQRKGEAKGRTDDECTTSLSVGDGIAFRSITHVDADVDDVAEESEREGIKGGFVRSGSDLWGCNKLYTQKEISDRGRAQGGEECEDESAEG